MYFNQPLANQILIESHPITTKSAGKAKVRENIIFNSIYSLLMMIVIALIQIDIN